MIHFKKLFQFTSQLLPLILLSLFFLMSGSIMSQSKRELRRANSLDSLEVYKNIEKLQKSIEENSKKKTLIDIDGEVRQAIITDGDTLYVFEMEEVLIFAPRKFKNRYEQARYNRLVRNVKRVYPYAKIAGEKYREYNEMLLAEPNEKKRDELMKEAEQDIKDSFEGDLRKLTISQGFILVKLVDRETQNTTYEVLKEFRGVFSAVFWQGLGRLFGYNLKSQYDAEGEDRLIEEIIIMIEAGAI
ncbi:MAG: DUF4294 domain-containing protein [Bacteroidota bacterium]